MTTNNAFEMEKNIAGDSAMTGSAGSALSGLSNELLDDFRKVFPKSQEKHEDLKLNDMLLCLAKVGGGDKEISKSEFKEKLGDQAAEFLEKIGCEKIRISGDNVKLELDRAKTVPIGENGIKDVKLAKEIDLKVSKNGDEISVTDVKGIRVNPKWLPEFALPDFKITPKGIDIGSVLPYIPAPGAYDQLNGLIEKLGK